MRKYFIKISYFPNPSNDFIIVKNLNSSIAYEIINLSGKRVISGISDRKIEIKNLEKEFIFSDNF